MKRILPVVLALAILFPALLLPAAAAEQTVYEFEYMEPVMTFDDEYDFPYTSEYDQLGISTYSYLGHLPEGEYILKITNPSGITVESSSFYISFPGWLKSERSKIYSSPRLSDSDYLISIYAPFIVIRYFRESTDVEIASYTSIYVTYWYPPNNPETYTSFGSLPAGYSVSLISTSSLISVQLDKFFDTLKTGFEDLTTFSLAQIFITSLGIVSSPVILWFGFRYVKAKVKKSFMKGKI